MGKTMLEFCLGAFAGLIALMALAYLSVELLGAGPVTFIRTSEVEPFLKEAPVQLLDAERAPIVMMIAPQPALAGELRP